MRDGIRTTATMFRALPWLCVLVQLCATGCPSTGSSIDAATDRGLVDLPSADASTVPDATVPDATLPTCVPGMAVACVCTDGRAGAQRCNSRGQYDDCVCAVADGGSADVPPRMLPPRLLTPHSVSRATTQRPTFRWVLPDGVPRARVTLARDRALTREARSETVTSASWRPAEALAFGVWFWRVEGLGDDGGAVWTSATWEFRAPRRDTAVDSSWGTLRDVHGDGYDDLVTRRRDGQICVYNGSAMGISTTPTATIVPSSDVTATGGPVRHGDFNGDGIADIAVPLVFPYVSPDAGAEFRVEGSVIDVYLGGASGLPAIRSSRHTIPYGARWMIGYEMAIGDFDGDGYCDLATGIDHYCDGSGLSCVGSPHLAVYRGSATGLDPTASMTRRFMELADGLRGVADTGDTDGDGYADLMTSQDDTGDGGVLLVQGSPVGTMFSTRLLPPSATYFAHHLSAAGDMNGDGYSDMAIAAGGRVNIYLGSNTFSGNLPDQVLIAPNLPSGLSPQSGYGSKIAAGDLNGDGYSDMVVAAPEAAISTSGHVGVGYVYLYLGSRTGANASLFHSWNGLSFGPGFGDAISTNLDLNGDGYDELLISGYHDGGVLAIYTGPVAPAFRDAAVVLSNVPVYGIGW